MKKVTFYYPLLLVLFSLFTSCEKKTELAQLEDIRGRIGDQAEWASTHYDDRHWEQYIDSVQGETFWIRFHFSISKEADLFNEKGISIGATGAYELFWDGHYLGKNGVLRTADQPEIHGDYLKTFLVPDSLSGSGKHLLALRMTKAGEKVGLHAFFGVDKYSKLLTQPLQVSLYMFMFAGAFLIIAIYFFFTFVNERKNYATLIFSIICIIFFGLLLAEYFKLFQTYPYPLQRTRLEIIGYLHISLTLLIPFFFLIQFSPPKRWIILLLITTSALFVQLYFKDSFDYRAWLQNILMWLFSTIIIAYGCYKKRSGAYIVMAGLLASVILIFWVPTLNIPYVQDFDVSVFIGFIIIVLVMLYVMTLRRREEQKQYEASLILSERLKNELLRKNIKPHFIMNTLTSLIDWVEDAPKEGVKFIYALADEFEVLNKMADKKLTPITQEIELCKSHIKVMGYRKEVNYIWQDQNIDAREYIPPAIIHTIVENGVTHSMPDKDGRVTFKLSFEEHTSFKQYTLLTIAKNRPPHSSGGTGTGLKYIRSRLQESYPDRWSFISKEHPNGWETVIKIARS